MEEIILISIFALVLAVVIFLFSSKTKAKNNSGLSQEEYSQKPFSRHSKEFTLLSKHASVTISHDTNACAEVKALGSKRFLVREAPIIPLKNCTQSTTCQCRYLHHNDRRTMTRRDETTESNERKAKLRGSTD